MLYRKNWPGNEKSRIEKAKNQVVSGIVEVWPNSWQVRDKGSSGSQSR